MLGFFLKVFQSISLSTGPTAVRHVGGFGDALQADDAALARAAGALAAYHTDADSNRSDPSSSGRSLSLGARPFGRRDHRSEEPADTAAARARGRGQSVPAKQPSHRRAASEGGSPRARQPGLMVELSSLVKKRSAGVQRRRQEAERESLGLTGHSLLS